MYTFEMSLLLPPGCLLFWRIGVDIDDEGGGSWFGNWHSTPPDEKYERTTQAPLNFDVVPFPPHTCTVASPAKSCPALSPIQLYSPQSIHQSRCRKDRNGVERRLHWHAPSNTADTLLVGLILHWLVGLREGLELGLCRSRRHAMLLTRLKPRGWLFNIVAFLTVYHRPDVLIDSISAKASSKVTEVWYRLASRPICPISAETEAPLAWSQHLPYLGCRRYRKDRLIFV
jgi:hypothetical protein